MSLQPPLNLWKAGLQVTNCQVSQAGHIEPWGVSQQALTHLHVDCTHHVFRTACNASSSVVLCAMVCMSFSMHSYLHACPVSPVTQQQLIARGWSQEQESQSATRCTNDSLAWMNASSAQAAMRAQCLEPGESCHISAALRLWVLKVKFPASHSRISV